MRRYIHDRILPSKPARLLIETGMKWDRDNCSNMAAALAYHALFSLFPLILIVFSVIGSLLGPDTEAFQFIEKAIEKFLPPQAREVVENTIVALNDNSVGAGLVGFGLLIFSASTIFAILKTSLDTIWIPREIEPASRPIRKIVRSFVLDKLFSFLLVFSTTFILLASLLANIGIKIILEIITTFNQNIPFFKVDELILSKGLQIGASFLIISVAIAVLFKSLPSVPVRWGDVWLAAILTTLLLLGLQQLASNSIISIGGHFLSYGVIGSVMILLLWIYLTCQIFLIGSEFSYVYARMFGSYRHRADRF